MLELLYVGAVNSVLFLIGWTSAQVIYAMQPKQPETAQASTAPSGTGEPGSRKRNLKDKKDQ